MSIRFDCPHCKAHYDVADDLGGKMIMCRVCQKRASVKAASTAPASAAPAAAAMAKASAPSRRNFLVVGGGIVASLGAIATGALLARQPWKRWGNPSTEADDGPGGRRRRGGPPPDGQPQGGPGNPPPPPPPSGAAQG